MEAFERRAAEAEERLSLLEKKVAGKSSGGGAMSDEKLAEVLSVLYQVRGALGKEKNNQRLAERKQAALEKSVKALEDENSKLKYQILHLKRNLQERM
mmetsp:Transcript_1987/g.5054  ORF Transcript_1987/g.5054 Transcript_1987/m.5054 type:complete len:98 (-) Transcript_1987:33-326(-)